MAINGQISKTRERNITKEEATRLRDQMNAIKNSTDNLIPDHHLSYWGGIITSILLGGPYGVLIGFAGYVTIGQAIAIREDASKRYTFYDNIVKGYNRGNLAYIVIETAQYIETPTDRGWIPYGNPVLVRYQTASGEWATID